MNEVIQFLVQAFRDLPDGLKLLLFVGLIACLVILAIWKYVSWRRLKDITKALRRKEEELHNATKDRDQLQARLDALDKVDEHVWARPDSLRQNRFTSRAERRTRFVAVCNLKGGVCKTTLTLNLGVGLALAGKRVLLVDFDFQATLSNFLLAEDLLRDYRQKSWTSDLLISSDATKATVGHLIFPSKDVPTCRAVIARERLEIEEYAQQARFYVNQAHEVRFLTQGLLHTPEILQAYDYVFFDCPPRMTTACINALTCADHVLIPTSLSQGDIEAVPRTLKWLRELHQVVRADLLGVVVAQCKMRAGSLVRFDQGQLNSLEQLIRGHLPGGQHIFSAKIAHAPDVHRATAQRRPAILDNRDLFTPVCQEFERRVHS